MAEVSGNGHNTASVTQTREYQQEQARRASAFQQLSDHGLNRWGGYLRDEFLVQLQGDSGRRVYREMQDNCPIIGALLQAIEMAVRAVTWRVEPASEGREDENTAQFVDECLSDMSFTWQDTLSDILTFLPFGWAYSELVYKRRGGDTGNPTTRSRYTDGRIGWRKLVTIAQESLDRWDFQDDGGINGVYQRSPNDGIERYIPLDKALLFRTTAKRNNPEGFSILRRAYSTWYYRKNVLEILGIGLERDLTGLPVVIAPEGVDVFAPENVTLLSTLKQIVRDLKADEQAGVILPYGFDFKLLASPGSRQHNLTEVLNYLDRRIALTALAQFLLLGMEKVGSFALSESQGDLFTLSLTGWVDSIKQVFNLHAIPRLLRLNGMQVKELPRLEHGSIGSPNLAELSEYVNKLVGANVLNPDEDMERHLRQVANLPELPEGKPEEPPRPTLTRERITRQRQGLLSDEQTLREIGYSEELIQRILEEKRAGKLQNSNIGEMLLRGFERGELTGAEE